MAQASHGPGSARGERASGERASGERASGERARAGPPAEEERPTALLAAVVLAALLGVGVIVGAATVHDLARHGGSVPGGTLLGLVLLALAAGMYRRRRWALLGFQALLLFQLLVTSLALIVASTLFAAAVCLASILLAGWLFWRLVGVMARIGASER